MTSDKALSKFLESMKLSYSEWHDGVGYDLEALSQLEEEHLRTAEDVLIARKLADWRDVEALAHIGSERATAELFKGLQAVDLNVRGEVLIRLISRRLLSDEQIDCALADAIQGVSLVNGLTKIFKLANSHRSPAVRNAVLKTALDGKVDARCHAAALAHFIHGGSSAMFDTAFRPLYLRFNSEARGERVAAFRELCGMIGLDARLLLSEFKEASR